MRLNITYANGEECECGRRAAYIVNGKPTCTGVHLNVNAFHKEVRVTVPSDLRGGFELARAPRSSQCWNCDNETGGCKKSGKFVVSMPSVPGIVVCGNPNEIEHLVVLVVGAAVSHLVHGLGLSLLPSRLNSLVRMPVLPAHLLRLQLTAAHMAAIRGDD